MREHSRDWPSVDLNRRQLCDLELLLNGAYSPLVRYMGSTEYAAVCDGMRLPDGTLWPLPVTLDVAADLAESLAAGATLALRDEEGVMIAAVHVAEVWQPDREAEVHALFDTEDPTHTGVAQHLHRTGGWAVAGRVEGVRLSDPVWARDSELFYWVGDRCFAVTVATTPGLDFGEPEALFASQRFTTDESQEYDVTADGRRILMVKIPEASKPREVQVVLNWFPELERLAGPGGAR